MRNLFYCDTVGPIGSGGLLVLRLVMGVAFMFHGWPKIQNPWGWMGAEAQVPAILQVLAALAEFGGGLGLIAGLLTRLAAPGAGDEHERGAGFGSFAAGRPFRGQAGRPVL